ncbi:enoyl-CoA hydratase [Evansella vedderi]|nr:enoyl-CoA hydratase [Evansella vedderi]
MDVSIKGHIAYLTLKRKGSANALSQALLDEMMTVFQQWKFDPSIRTIIITGDGDNVFCAGADLKERRDMNETQVRQAVNKIRQTIQMVEDMPIPVIAAINGSAIGGGLELALACDLRLASDQAKFALTETTLAIIPGAGGTQRLPRAIGTQRAKEMIYTGKRITAETAESWGLILKVVSQDSLLEEATKLANEIGQNGPIAIKQAKFAINQGIEVDLKTGLSIEEKAYELTIPTKDRKEGLTAFKEKRSPVYTGE